MHRIGQEDQNNFLTDQMSRFWLTSVIRAPGRRQKRHWVLIDRFSATSRDPNDDMKQRFHGAPLPGAIAPFYLHQRGHSDVVALAEEAALAGRREAVHFKRAKIGSNRFDLGEIRSLSGRWRS